MQETKEIDMTAVPETCEYDTSSFCRVPGHVTGDTSECTACGTVRTAIEIKSLARQLYLESTKPRR